MISSIRVDAYFCTKIHMISAVDKSVREKNLRLHRDVSQQFLHTTARVASRSRSSAEAS